MVHGRIVGTLLSNMHVWSNSWFSVGIKFFLVEPIQVTLVLQVAMDSDSWKETNLQPFVTLL